MLARVVIFAGLVAIVAVVVPQLDLGAFIQSTRGAPDMAERQTARAPAAPERAAAAANKQHERQPTRRGRTVLEAGRSGHFVAKAQAGGRTFDVLVDTGATAVALTDETARRLGIRPSSRAYTLRLSTANGIVNGAPVRLPAVRLGQLTVRDVEAVVLPPGALDINLLGMSFLGRLSHFELSGDRLILIQ